MGLIGRVTTWTALGAVTGYLYTKSSREPAARGMLAGAGIGLALAVIDRAFGRPVLVGSLLGGLATTSLEAQTSGDRQHKSLIALGVLCGGIAGRILT